MCLESRTNRSELVIFSSHLNVPGDDDDDTNDDCNVLRCAAEATMCWNNIVVIGSKTYGDSYRIEANQMTWITQRKPEPNQDIY